MIIGSILNLNTPKTRAIKVSINIKKLRFPVKAANIPVGIDGPDGCVVVVVSKVISMQSAGQLS